MLLPLGRSTVTGDHGESAEQAFPSPVSDPLHKARDIDQDTAESL